MQRLCLLVVFAVLTQGAFGFRIKRQAENGASTPTQLLQSCIRSCPVTSEYNPVCGSNFQTYDNPGRLLCAQACGVDVTQMRSSRCPATTPAPVPAS